MTYSSHPDYKGEQGPAYYDSLFSRDMKNPDRYDNIHQLVGEWVGSRSVTDIGCGTAEVAKYIPDYMGFDFSTVAIDKCVKKNLHCWQGDARDPVHYGTGTDIFIALEVLEHIMDDLTVVGNIPKGREFIFSVPRFIDPSHVRVFTEERVRERYPMLTIKDVVRYNWDDTEKKWSTIAPDTEAYILLVRSLT